MGFLAEIFMKKYKTIIISLIVIVLTLTVALIYVSKKLNKSKIQSTHTATENRLAKIDSMLLVMREQNTLIIKTLADSILSSEKREQIHIKNGTSALLNGQKAYNNATTRPNDQVDSSFYNSYIRAKTRYLSGGLFIQHQVPIN